MSEIDLSLPESVSAMAEHQDRPMSLDTFALYNLVENEQEPSDLIEQCHSNCPRDDYIRFRKAPSIRSLKGIIDLHLQTTIKDGFDPNLFLVVTDTDWRHHGLVIVTLSDDEGKPDKFNIKVADSGILLVDLQIGNTDWYEAKENYEVVGEDETADIQPEGTFSDGASKRKPATGFYIALYAIPGIDPNALVRAVEPFHDQKAPEDRICRFERFLTTDRDLVSQVMDSWHPEACMSNTYLCKMYLLVADSLGYAEDGLLMCSVREHKTKRVVCNQGVTVPEFCNVAQGSKSWDELVALECV